MHRSRRTVGLLLMADALVWLAIPLLVAAGVMILLITLAGLLTPLLTEDLLGIPAWLILLVLGILVLAALLSCCVALLPLEVMVVVTAVQRLSARAPGQGPALLAAALVPVTTLGPCVLAGATWAAAAGELSQLSETLWAATVLVVLIGAVLRLAQLVMGAVLALRSPTPARP